MDSFDVYEQGRCSYCHHVRSLNKDVLRVHTYLGSAVCPGSDKPPLATPLSVRKEIVDDKLE